MDRQAGKTAFVLAGGGSLGAVQVGMLKALQAEGVVADLVVGSSVGAINAAYFAAAPNRDGLARLEQIWLGLRREEIFPFSLTDTLLALLRGRDYLVTPRQLRRLIESRLPYRRLEEAVLPCHVVATDVLTGRETIISQGEALPALLASTAIPAVFPSVNLGGQPLMDGGIASNTPISAAVALGASRVLVLPTGTPCALKAPPHGALATALHAINLLAMRQLVADVDRFANRCELIVLPPLCPQAVNTYDFTHTAELIESAERAARHWLQNDMERLQGKDPHQLLEPHSH